MTVRLGAVGYLNARPLVYGLDRDPRFALRFDVPSACSSLLHADRIDVGMIPSIEYQRGSDDYRIVPGLGIISDGDVASVALFSRVPIDRVTRLGLDTSSRTSAGLTRVMCREVWRIDPAFVDVSPEAAVRVDGCDAALVIGDPALFLDHASAGFTKIDLGGAWTRATGLPFVWAVWAGRAGALRPEHVAALQTAAREGVAHSDDIADAYAGPERAALCRVYFREHIKYALGEREIAGLTQYWHLAARHGVIAAARPAVFYEAG
ncbi:MAG TPA: menaquinone biosynthesis protein [Vicinamibacterales bacterium]|nr:menaquinone biosynthesis protein [Vicinamibacterales bacterium]